VSWVDREKCHYIVWHLCYLEIIERKKTMPKSTIRSEKLDLRLSPAAKQKLYRAAAAANRSVSDFVLESAMSRADETLIDRRYFGLDAERWAAFMEALEAPPRSHPRMERLLTEPSIFDSEAPA
jgi:uncharacterized protein (DUF1778 family)